MRLRRVPPPPLLKNQTPHPPTPTKTKERQYKANLKELRPIPFLLACTDYLLSFERCDLFYFPFPLKQNVSAPGGTGAGRAAGGGEQTMVVEY